MQILPWRWKKWRCNREKENLIDANNLHRTQLTWMRVCIVFWRNLWKMFCFFFTFPVATIRQYVPGHEWNYSQLFASRWFERTLSHHRRANISGYFPLHRYIVSSDTANKFVFYGCRRCGTPGQNESATWPTVSSPRFICNDRRI